MLSEITIENVAVIEKATAGFAGGFTVLTGETGAGKSILIDSINAILGNRTSRDIVRGGAAKAGIWATFSLLPPAVRQRLEAGGYAGDDELLLQREVGADGKGACRIGGAPATAAILRDICAGLISIHGQHDNQSLLNPAAHIGMLDAFAANGELLREYGAAHGRLADIAGEMGTLTMNEGEKKRRIDLLKYELEEIEKAAPEPGEDEELAARREVARNAQRIIEALNGAYTAIAGGDDEAGAATLLSGAAARVDEAARFAPEFAAYADVFNEAYYNVREAASDIQSRLAGLELDDGALEALEQRLDVLYRLKQKYGGTLDAVIGYGEKARLELEGIELSSERLAVLAKEEAQARRRAEELAERLTASREEAFKRLSADIADALAFLNMPGIAMALRQAKIALGPTGRDDMEFYISTNPGEPPKPLAKIASGGELARIMLAISSALALKDDVPTVIYDEIDTGVSGMAAGRIGQLLRQSAQSRQVICVTHTAQVAAWAQQHLLIEKHVEGGRTYTRIIELDYGARVNELARIISGDNVTDIARANAEEMLRLAQSVE